MKKIIVLLIAASLFAILILPVAAANTATLIVKNAVFDGETFTFRVQVTDVTDPTGFAAVAYTLVYDSARFEFVSAETTLPEEWLQYSNNPDYYDDMSMLSEKGTYKYAVLMYMTGVGGKSNELYTEYTFKVIGKNAEGKTFNIKNIDIVSDGFAEMYNGSGIKFVCETAEEVSEEEISEETSAEVSSEVSAEVSSETSIEPDESQKGSDESIQDDSSVPEESCESTAEESTAVDDEKPKSSPVLPIILIIIIGGVGSAALISYRKSSKK